MSRKISFDVVWSDTAENDLVGIVESVARDSVPNAEGILDALEKAADGLTCYPLRGRVVPELAILGVQSYRELIHKPWRIVYRIHNKSVLVLSVLDSRRNLADLLLARFYRS